MTEQSLFQLLHQYRAGIEAELVLLHQLEKIADRQRDTTAARDFEAFATESDARDQLTSSLVAIEEDLRGLRHTLLAHRAEAQRLDGYDTVVDLHRQATDLVVRILATDRESFRALSYAEMARRAAMVDLERGELTLKAYRKVLLPPIERPSLVSRRG